MQIFENLGLWPENKVFFSFKKRRAQTFDGLSQQKNPGQRRERKIAITVQNFRSQDRLISIYRKF